MINFFKKITTQYLLHPFLIGLYFILYGINQYELIFIDIEDVITILALASLPAILLFFVTNFFVKNPKKAALIATVLSIFILFYFHFFHNFCLLVEVPFLERQLFFLPFLSLLFAGLCLYYAYSKNTFSILNQYLNTLILVLIVFECAKITLHYQSSTSKYVTIQKEYAYKGQKYTDDYFPPIYHIVLDAYTGFDGLKKYWDFDNADFKKQLENRGFYVPANTRGNYIHTRQAMAAALNRDYFWDLDEREEKVSDYLFALSSIRHAKTFKDFETMGYDFINLSIFDILNESQMFEYSGIPKTSFKGFMLRKTLPEVYFSRKRTWMPTRLIKDLLTEIKASPERIGNRPTYVYAHLMIPHFPYFFDSEGNTHYDRNAKADRRNKAHYLEQLLYTNQRMIEVGDTILAKSAVPPIIMIHGDHGFRQLEDTPKDISGFSIDEASCTVLAAFYFPKKQYDMLYDSISPVNFFRAMLNAEFDTDFELLEDKLFHFRSLESEEVLAK